jgi:polysaccharide pyruvyl transferase WcaK-like protein
MSIALFNPSIVSDNLGDQIIIDAVGKEIASIFPNKQIINIPTQERIGGISINKSKRAAQRIVGGTNLLSSHMLQYKQWQIGLWQTLSLGDLTLMGVGWWQYQKNPDYYTRTVLKRVLSKRNVHSVRDEYTRQKLAAIGINNVVNTGCPTMWQLTAAHCREIPVVKSRTVVFTLTDYSKSPESDAAFIKLLRNQYDNIHFWPQGAGDLDYFRNLGVAGVRTIQPSLAAYDDFLRDHGMVDFVGTRLHGGVRALQARRRALILAVDNRAVEISKNTNLAVIDRHEAGAIKKWILEPQETKIGMNFEAIRQWREQFCEAPGTTLLGTDLIRNAPRV